jgi:hypothetical protein
VPAEAGRTAAPNSSVPLATASAILTNLCIPKAPVWLA